jgi:hypothetical protein
VNPLRTLRDPARRQFLRNAAWAASGAIVGSVIGQAVIDPIVEPVAEPIRGALYGPDDTIDPTSTDVTNARLASMAENAIAAARDIAAETGGLNPLWWERAERAGVLRYTTHVRRRDNGKLVIVGHGDGLVLWGKDAPERMKGVPLDEQPDRKFGRFADRCMWEAMQARKPALHARRAETIVKGHDRPRMVEYLAWTASEGDEAVSVALTLAQVALGRSPERSSPDTAAEARSLLSHDATRPSRTSRLAQRLPRSERL